MGLFSKPKAPDTSAQEELVRKQEAQLAEQKRQAQLEEDRLRDERVSKQKALAGRLRGRRSLIKTSELGTTDKLG